MLMLTCWSLVYLPSVMRCEFPSPAIKSEQRVQVELLKCVKRVKRVKVETLCSLCINHLQHHCGGNHNRTTMARKSFTGVMARPA